MFKGWPLIDFLEVEEKLSAPKKRHYIYIRAHSSLAPWFSH